MRHLAGDRIFFTLVIGVSLAGLAIFASAALGMLARESSSVSKDILLQTGLGLGLGFLAIAVVRKIPLATIKRAAPYVYGITLVLTSVVFVPGIGLTANGATRWIDLGFTTFQPAEFLKIGLVLVLAWWLSLHARELKDPKKGIVPLFGFLAIPALLLLAQPNTSTTMLLVLTAGVMYFVAGAPWRDFGLLMLVAVLALGLIIMVRPYVLERVKTFVNPAQNALGSGYQIQQSMIAVGSGGVLGRGFGQSVGKFNYLPEPAGDSVFAVFAEETGFVGAVALLLSLVALVARGIVIAAASRDLFGALVALGFSALIIIQVFINVCAMIGIIPLTGLPLPFVSHGGTALLATLAMCGLILNVAAHKKA
jgi:cell division protein FtsW